MTFSPAEPLLPGRAAKCSRWVLWPASAIFLAATACLAAFAPALWGQNNKLLLERQRLQAELKRVSGLQAFT